MNVQSPGSPDQEDAHLIQMDQDRSKAAANDQQQPILAVRASSLQLPIEERFSMGHAVTKLPTLFAVQETGREGITDAAMSDGSSFFCQKCGGVVSRNRESQHHLWCCS